MQILVRRGHFPLNSFMYKIGRTVSDTCMECYEIQDDGPISETINHYLFECPAHAEFRNELITKTGRNRFNLHAIMANTDHMKALVTYTNRTGRFKD